jgi:cyclopropane fatty-acyl-phospholipid synthase-like methyltransferase
MSKLPAHLGGHQNVNHLDLGAITYLKDRFGIESALDIGCGLGHMQYEFAKIGVSFAGVDGDGLVKRPQDVEVVVHDYTLGINPLLEDKQFDLAWSTEFVEHVAEEFIPNYMEDFLRCRIAAITFAHRGMPGHHHVNCQDEPYWISVFDEYGFDYCFLETQLMRTHSTMRKAFVRERGLVFQRRD